MLHFSSVVNSVRKKLPPSSRYCGLRRDKAAISDLFFLRNSGSARGGKSVSRRRLAMGGLWRAGRRKPNSPHDCIRLRSAATADKSLALTSMFGENFVSFHRFHEPNLPRNILGQENSENAPLISCVMLLPAVIKNLSLSPPELLRKYESS